MCNKNHEWKLKMYITTTFYIHIYTHLGYFVSQAQVCQILNRWVSNQVVLKWWNSFSLSTSCRRHWVSGFRPVPLSVHPPDAVWPEGFQSGRENPLQDLLVSWDGAESCPLGSITYPNKSATANKRKVLPVMKIQRKYIPQTVQRKLYFIFQQIYSKMLHSISSIWSNVHMFL